MAIERDEFGPEYIVDAYDPATGMRGFLVIDNTAFGPGKGGMRMTEEVSAEEVFRLARTMTWKNALAEIPFGGAKSGIIWSGGSPEKKKAYVQAFARRLKPLTPKYYITAPDVNVGEREMQWFVEATGNWRSATGKPAALCTKLFGKGERCGIPHEYGSTGFGVAHATAVAIGRVTTISARPTVAIQGFGNVGSFTCKYLAEMGFNVVAVSDKDGAVYDERGIDTEKMLKIHEQGFSVTEYSTEKRIPRDDILELPVDILIPAAVTDAIHEDNKDAVKARIIVEAANIPMRDHLHEELSGRGILIVPDMVANAGGVISSYAEYRGYNPKRMFDLIERKITKVTKLVLRESVAAKISPRRAALQIAKERLRARHRSHAIRNNPRD